MVSLDQKSSLSPPSPPPLPGSPITLPTPFSILLVSPSSPQSTYFPFTLCLPSPSPLLLSSPPPPLSQPPGPAFGPLEARWPLCSWHHGVWKVRTPARGKWLMMSCQLVRPQGCYVTTCNNMADRNPLPAAPVWISSHPCGERKELRCILLPLPNYLPLGVSAAGTSDRHGTARGSLGRRVLS